MQALQAFFDEHCHANGEHPDCTARKCHYDSEYGCWHPSNPAQEIVISAEIRMSRMLAEVEAERCGA